MDTKYPEDTKYTTLNKIELTIDLWGQVFIRSHVPC